MEPSMEKPRKKRRWWLLIVILFLLCLLGALFILMFFPRSQASQVPQATSAQTTNDLIIAISPAAIKPQEVGDAFIVRANTDLTLHSQDESDHTCSISGSGIPQPITVKLVAGVAVKKFKLPAGKYQLTCDGLTKRILVITAQ
jgi:hypothetical protein